jgi:hypothetical protein
LNNLLEVAAKSVLEMNSSLSFLVSDNLLKLETDYSRLLALIKEELELRQENNTGNRVYVLPLAIGHKH